MAYEVVMPYHLHMPSYFLETFTEYPLLIAIVYNICVKERPKIALFYFESVLFFFFSSLNCVGVIPFICLKEVLK